MRILQLLFAVIVILLLQDIPEEQALPEEEEAGVRHVCLYPAWRREQLGAFPWQPPVRLIKGQDDTSGTGCRGCKGKGGREPLNVSLERGVDAWVCSGMIISLCLGWTEKLSGGFTVQIFVALSATPTHWNLQVIKMGKTCCGGVVPAPRKHVITNHILAKFPVHS
ncbi:hypothetical protein BTVI_96351 [Pitangus sulphuratus]|nr:hypothetical protein BTVI_96351 [Pitangus sulphuratus]